MTSARVAHVPAAMLNEARFRPLLDRRDQALTAVDEAAAVLRDAILEVAAVIGDRAGGRRGAGA